MLKKASLYIVVLMVGIILAGTGLILSQEELKAVSGICIGVGSGIFGMSFSRLLAKRFERKNPGMARQNEIELHDERNTMIRNRAKAKSADAVQWLILGLAFLLILINAPLWATLASVGVYLLYHLLYFYYIGRYQKEL